MGATGVSMQPERRASIALRWGCALQSAAFAYVAFRHGTPIQSALFMEFATSEDTSVLADRGFASLAALCAFALCLRSLGWPALGVATGFAAVAAGAIIAGGRAFSELTVFGHAARWLAPLALAALWLGRDPTEPSPRRRRLAAWLLRIAVASTFAVHGWQAVQHAPAFVDLLLGTSRQWFGAAPSERTAGNLLTAIGCMDLALAATILVWRTPRIAAWAAVWGTVTLLSRTTAYGLEFWADSFVRAMNALAPFALWWLWRDTSAPPKDTSR